MLDWGVEVILWLQRFSPELDGVGRAVTFLGDTEFFLLLLPLVYWVLDRRVGMRLAILFLLSAFVNVLAKELAGQPRPFAYDLRVEQLVDAGPYGIPSGHTQSAVVVWGWLAFSFRRRWLWVLAAALMVLVPVSRVYLGVHFPTDLVGGYVLGAVVLVAFVRWWPEVEGWLCRLTLVARLAVVTAVPLVAVLLRTSDDGAATGGALLGMSVGFVLERELIGYEAGGGLRRRALRLLPGFAVLVGLWAGLRVVFAGLEPVLALRLVRYALVGLWGALGAPWLFVVMRLAAGARKAIPAR